MANSRLQVKVQPGARSNEVLGFQGDVLRLRVTAPPERGRANEAVIDMLAEVLGLSKSRLAVIKGAASRSKVIAVEGLDDAAVRRRLVH